MAAPFIGREASDERSGSAALRSAVEHVGCNPLLGGIFMPRLSACGRKCTPSDSDAQPLGKGLSR